MKIILSTITLFLFIDSIQSFVIKIGFFLRRKKNKYKIYIYKNLEQISFNTAFLPGISAVVITISDFLAASRVIIFYAA